MSLLVPNQRDHVDAHADLDQDELYRGLVEKIRLESPQELSWRFSAVPGFFVQSDPDTDDMNFNYALQDFGLKKPWEQLIEEVDHLNETSAGNECYKVVFLARHGQGFHNIASQKFSKEDWMAKWRFLGTDGEITWGPDPDLTELGVQQAVQNNEFWLDQLSKGAPIPSKFFVSPLRRSASTLVHTWKSIDIPKPVVCEGVRETIGLHLCHKRSTKSTIEQLFPNFDFEPGFTEDDQLERVYSSEKEQLHEQFLRINYFLQKLFESDWDGEKVDKSADSTFVNVTSHAGTMRAFITVVNHRKFTIPTGGQIPIVVKGVRKV